MSKYKVIAFILLTAVLISGKAFCQQANNDQQVLMITGTVTAVDVEGGVITLQTDTGKMMFYLSGLSDLYRSTYHIASIEIESGDPVVVQYTSTASGKNIITKLVDNKIEKG